MSAESEFAELPTWLQYLWNNAPLFARVAESELSTLHAEHDALRAQVETLRAACKQAISVIEDSYPESDVCECEACKSIRFVNSALSSTAPDASEATK